MKRLRVVLRRKGVTAGLVIMGATLFMVNLHQTHYFRQLTDNGYQGIGSVRRLNFEDYNMQISPAEVLSRFQRRKERVHQACLRLRTKPYQGLRHAAQRFIFPTNTSPTVLYCPVPKTGTTFLKKTFAEAINKSRVIWNDRFFVRPVYNYDKTVMFFFTREPYSRLFSAYVDKFWSPNLYFWRVLGTKLVQLVRPDANATSLDCGHDVTFPEFIRYLIESKTKGYRINSHLVPTSKFCQACDYNYDFIGKLETFREDAAYILSTINVPSLKNCSNDNDIIMDHITQAYYTFFIDKKHCLGKKQLLLKAWRALQIRGMISFSLPYPFMPSLTQGVPKATFTKIVYKAVQKTDELFEALDSQYQSNTDPHLRHPHTGQSGPKLTARAQQRRMAMSSAFSLISMAEREETMKLLRDEFDLFGYEARPDEVFNPKDHLNPNIFELSDI